MSDEQNNDQQKSLNDEQIINKNTKEKTDLSKDTESEKNITNKNSRNIKKNGRSNNKRRDRNELPPNVDNLPPLSLQDMQTTEINDIKSIAEEYELQDFAGYSKHQLIFEVLKTHGRRGGPLQGKRCS